MTSLLTVVSTCGFSVLLGFFFRIGWLLATDIWGIRKEGGE